MNTLLENYLSDTRENLSHLPSWKRDLELMELRSHLEADVAARMELGSEEEAATRETLLQFGEVREICGGLNQAHRRERVRRFDTPFGALGLAMGLFAVMSAFWFVVNTCILATPALGIILAGMVPLLGWASFMVVGWVTGRLAPRNAVAGVALGYAAFVTLFLVVMPLCYSLLKTPVTIQTPGLIAMAQSIFCLTIPAWMASRYSRTRALSKAAL